MFADWLLELGHTRLKLARRGKSAPGPATAMPLKDFPAWLKATRPAPGTRFWLAAVPVEAVIATVTDRLARAGMDCRRIRNGSVDLPVAPSYSGLGVDRWLAVQPPWRERQAAFCVVDCGSATTIDLVDDRGIHRGGWILPGIEASRSGLLSRAPVLKRPAVTVSEPLQPATDTVLAIERGLLLQQAGAIRLALASAQLLLHCEQSLPLILTGGASASLQSLLEPNQNEPDLVLCGLWMAVDCWIE
ncbi:MAG: type III pantothenate kinase [Wenzhouxiangellaceae bacterium]